jgi:hypothetical protein
MCCKVRYEAVLMLLIRCTATRQSWWSVRRVPLPEATPYLTLDILAPATSRLVGSLAVFHLHNVPTNLSEMSPSIMTTGVLRLSLCQAGIVNGLANVDVENVFCKPNVLLRPPGHTVTCVRLLKLSCHRVTGLSALG